MELKEIYISGYHSDNAHVDSGVQQATVLGPLLFLCHINDLPECVKSQVRLFADDCLLQSIGTTLRTVQCAQRQQRALVVPNPTALFQYIYNCDRFLHCKDTDTDTDTSAFCDTTMLIQTRLEFYVFIMITWSIPLPVEYQSSMVSFSQQFHN